MESERAMNPTRAWSGIAAAVVLLGVGCTAGPQPPPAQVPGRPAVTAPEPDGLTGQAALVHLQALQRIADQNGGNRASPGPGYDASVDYVVGVLRGAGWEVSTPMYDTGSGGDEEGGGSGEDGEGDDSGAAEAGNGGGAQARQVVAQTTSGTSGLVVIAGAHLDSVREGPGITDDGSGVAALLATAEHLGATPAVPNTVRLAFWGSEEEERQGSRSYVGALNEADRAAIVAYLNLDMISSSNAGYFVQGGAPGGGTSGSGPPGSAEIGRVLIDQIARTGVTGEIIRFTGDDDTAFVEAGVPTGGLVNGDASRKSPQQAVEWGGQPGVPFDPCYHAACDAVAQVNPIALDRYTRAAGWAIQQFAELPGRPTD